MAVSTLRLLVFAGSCAAALCSLGADSVSISEKRLELLFRPTLGERMALSPDGHHLAYTRHANGNLMIVVMDLERLETKAHILADEDRPILHSKEKQRAELRFLDWSADNRLVFAPTIEVIEPGVKPPDPAFLRAAGIEIAVPPLEPVVLAPVMVVNADGTEPRQLFDAKEVAYSLSSSDPSQVAGRTRTPRPEIRGFLAGDRNQLLIEVAGDFAEGIPATLYRLDLQAGKLAELSGELMPSRLIYDQRGQPRMSQESVGRTGGSSFSYRPADGKRWGKMPEPGGADGGARFELSSANYLGERIIPLGFDHDPNVLIYASNVGRDTFGIFGLDLATRRRTTLVLQHPHRDLASPDDTIPSRSLVFDRFRLHLAGVRAPGPRPLTVWVDAELAAVQRAIEARFPQRNVVVHEWNEARTRFLVQVTGGTELGRTYLFQKPEGLMVELMRRAPWLPNAELNQTRFIEFAGPGGALLTGYLTVPRAPRLTPTPLILWFAPGLPPQPHPEFDPQAQVLADMGFIVCRLNNRGVLGLGAKHRDALRLDPDHATGADALAAIEWIATQHRIDRRRIATLGEGFAGHLALRVTQAHPGVFRCAVLIEPILNLSAWTQPAADASGPPTLRQEINRLYLAGSGADLSRLSTTAHAADLNAAVFLLTRSDSLDDAGMTVAAGVSQLRSQLKRRDLPCVTVDYTQDYTLGLPAARARVYRQLEEFFNLNLYHFDVKIGPTREVK